MSRNSSISPASEFLAWRATAQESSTESGRSSQGVRLLLLGELVGRDRNRDFTWFRIEPGRQHEHGAVGQAAQHPDQRKKTKQARHRNPSARPVCRMKEWKNYDTAATGLTNAPIRSRLSPTPARAWLMAPGAPVLCYLCLTVNPCAGTQTADRRAGPPQAEGCHGGERD